MCMRARRPPGGRRLTFVYIDYLCVDVARILIEEIVVHVAEDVRRSGVVVRKGENNKDEYLHEVVLYA